MKENEGILKKMSVGDVLDYSIGVYKRNFKKVTLIALIFYVPFMLLYTLAVSYFSGELISFTGAKNNLNDVSSLPYMLLAYYAGIVVLGLIYLIYSLTLKNVMDASIIKIIYSDVVYKKEQDARGAIKEGFKKLPRLMGSKVLYYLIVLGVSIGAVIGLFIVIGIAVAIFGGTITSLGLAGFMGESIGSAAGAVIIVIILVILFLLVYIAAMVFIAYFAIKFGFGTHAVVLENRSAANGISRSSELTRKSFWHAAMSCMFGLLLFFGIPTILSVGSQMLLSVNKNMFIVLNTCTQIISSILYPYFITLLTLIFINLKIEKEGLDLEIKVDRLLAEQTKFEDGEAANV